MWLTHMTLHSATIIMLKEKAPRVRIKDLDIIIDLMVKENRTRAKAKALKERKVKDNPLKVPKEGKELRAKPP